MSERTPWWKAFLPKKKGGAKEPTTIGPDFDPWAPKTKGSGSKSEQPVPPPDPKNSSLLSDETYDDSHLESVFNEKTCRRNMNVSRSGRFKVKGKQRQGLPIQDKDKEEVR